MDLLMITVLIIGFLVIDAAWIATNILTYKKLVEGVQHSQLEARMFPAVIAYALMVLGYIAILLPLLEKKRAALEGKHPIQLLILALRYGGVFGFVVYGIFNATNLAMFKGYDALTALKDTLWGTFVYTLLCFATLLLMNAKYL